VITLTKTRRNLIVAKVTHRGNGPDLRRMRSALTSPLVPADICVKLRPVISTDDEGSRSGTTLGEEFELVLWVSECVEATTERSDVGQTWKISGVIGTVTGNAPEQYRAGVYFKGYYALHERIPLTVSPATVEFAAMTAA